MAKVEVPCQPGLTADDAMTLFAERFRGQYEVCKTRLFRRDFVVKKNWSTAVSVGLRQESGTTRFIVTGCQPSVRLGFAEFLAGMLLVEVIAIGLFGVVLAGGILFWVVGGCLGLAVDWMTFGSGRRALEGEIRAFVENAGHLEAPESSSRPSPGTVLPAAQVGVQPVFCASCSTQLAGQAPFCHVCGTPASSAGPDRQPSCTACEGLLGENARFCKACGAPVSVAESEAVHAGPDQLYCQQCGTQVPQSNLFCHKCGAEVASAKRGNLQIIGAASKPTSEAATRRGYCQRCGQELGVDEKMRGLAAHERCPAPATDTVGGDRSAATAPAAPDARVGGPSPTRGYCEVCGQELGVKEKMRGLASHERCAAPTSEAITASSVSEPLEAQPATTASPVPVPEPGPKVPGRCDLCGEELGVDQKLRGLSVHERCAGETPQAPQVAAAPSVSGIPEASQKVTVASPIPKPPPGPKTPGCCDLCGEELGVNEKLSGLATHEKCPMPVAEAASPAPAQASQVYCTECGTPMPASSRFCHKCGSAVVVAAE